MSAIASLVALDGVTTASGVSVAASPAGTSAADSGSPVAGRVLPLRTELAAVLPWPGLRRGSTVAVDESVALLFALLAEATTRGSWAAVVGLPGIGVVAASEAGVEVSRLALVPSPGESSLEVLAALLDGVDLVVVGAPRGLAAADARRLSARARHRGTVLLPFGEWPEADVRLRCSEARWRGLGAGHGHLREREVTVHARGRGAAARPCANRILLPSRDGALAVAETAEDRTPGEQPAGDRTCEEQPAGDQQLDSHSAAAQHSADQPVRPLRPVAG